MQLPLPLIKHNGERSRSNANATGATELLTLGACARGVITVVCLSVTSLLPA